MPYSFVPRWRPQFVTCLAPEDRCHLNGLGVARRHGALRHGPGRDRHAGGWREKKDGGVLIDVAEQ